MSPWSRIFTPASMSQRAELQNIAGCEEKVIKFDAETINNFLDTPIIFADEEEYPAYSQYLHSTRAIRPSR